ncbi:lipocalin family protein [Roseomonas sp. CGMCC 1.13459]|uniref:Outer membrane lipoprotein Blc n=2 Tax=Falsiroseomonas oleicola TaxID=2801474 RepID=A0ABS6H0J3_9PROT|nr:lipocalin family protein [Roseomonas oleicola]MBU8542176.1 lipocalin family protein [Roseomonas oleicola]
MKKAIVGLMLLLGACATTPARPPVATVPQVDLARYAGTWFEIARLPNSFQDGGDRGCTATTATYTPQPDGKVGVVNRCLAHDGTPRIAEGSAYAVEGSGNARLRVSFFWPFYGDYWVIGLDPAYRWAVVGAPGRDYLWILARRPSLAPGDYSEAVGIAAQQGFEVTRLQTTPQP